MRGIIINDFWMDSFTVTLLTILAVSPLVVFSYYNNDNCKSPQHLEIGRTGIVECSFQRRFYAVAWYTSAGLERKHALVRLIGGEKAGDGILTGEFDIRTDGSLIISKVTLQHDDIFTVMQFQSEGLYPVSNAVRVVVLVKPSRPFPINNVCQIEDKVCFTRLKQNSRVTCYIQNARPAVSVNLAVRTKYGDKNVTTLSYAVEKNFLFTSIAITFGAFSYSSLLSLLVCNADSLPGILEEDETYIFAENSDFEISYLTTKMRYVERNSRFELSCDEPNIQLIVWKKADRYNGTFRLLSYAAFFHGNISSIVADEYEMNAHGSLFVPFINVKDEGFYGCTFENGSSGGASLFHVIVYVSKYPVVGGCSDKEYCVLHVQAHGYLTCSVHGIRPSVQLEWRTSDRNDAPLISFSNQHTTVTSSGDVYDVVLKSTYHINVALKARLTMECRIIGPHTEVLKSTKAFDMYLASANSSEKPATSFNKQYLWLIVITVPLSLLLGIIGLELHRRRRRWERIGLNDPDEGMPMYSVARVEPEQEVSDQEESDLDVFLKQLKNKYKDQYDAVQPIPYIRDRLFCVDRVFVEGGFEKMTSRGKIGTLGNWKKLTSYHDVLESLSNDSSSTRTIIEGDPGYGKSTLTLQLAFDWCNSTAKSPLSNVHIFILLRLRQLSGVKSVYKAIKRFLLPQDTKLSETDIKNILRETNNSVIILDGYDEYPEEEAHGINDINSIIRGEMFQESKVFLTSRSSLLPKSFPPTTHRIRLTGFDEKARDAYICKAVTGEDPQAANNIKSSLKDNAVLQGLCQVPLFFVMFAHMTHESEEFLHFKSVSSFFGYMINCFHFHMRNKADDENVRNFTVHERNHEVLNEVAFEALNGKKQKIVWDKTEILDRLGDDFYNHYKRIGILVEEEVITLKKKPGDNPLNVEVRFYHKLFCEWYAAHRLSRLVVQTGDNICELLKYMNPFDLQYTYRFACGLSREAGDKIIEYLRGVKDGDKFAVLCILEQTGKIDQIKKTIRDLCSNCITIDRNDSMLLQGSTVQLLELGASNEMPISIVWLRDCFNSVDTSTGSILLKSELSMPVFQTLEELVIGERGRQINDMMLLDVIKYSLKCLKLRILRLCYLCLPERVHENCLTILKSRKLQILWITDEGDFCLDGFSGKWKGILPFFLNNTDAYKGVFIKELKEKYKEQYDRVQPIHGNEDICFCVDKIFVEGGLEKMKCDDNIRERGDWEKLTSYHEILNTPPSTRTIIEGGFGFGKSTLTLQFAYDWCNNKAESPLANVGLLILLRLMQLGGVTSVFKAVKQFILPKNSFLSVNDIAKIIQGNESTVIIIDGYDESLEDAPSLYAMTDMANIIMGKMFPESRVIVTTRFFLLPKLISPQTRRVRLTGFNECARNAYIKKAVVEDNATAAKVIMNGIMNDPLLQSLSHIPLLFVKFAHTAHKSDTFLTFESIAEVFKDVILCFHSHSKSKRDGADIVENTTLCNGFEELNQVAFDGLRSMGENPVWNESELNELLGSTAFKKYNLFKQCGIFIEKETIELANTINYNYSEVEVQFYHKLFCEWYAAHHISQKIVRDDVSPHKLLMNMDPFDVQYTFRFACGLSSDAGDKLIKYLQGIRDGEMFATLCTLEQSGKTDKIKELIHSVCSTFITIDSKVNKLLQGSIVQLLQIAAHSQIPVSLVWLKDCFNSVDVTTESILLNSKQSIPAISTMTELVLSERGRVLENVLVSGVLEYSLMCSGLKTLRFCHYRLPNSIQANCLPSLQSRDVQVLWITDEDDYRLNLRSGIWEVMDLCSSEDRYTCNFQAKKDILISAMKTHYKELTRVIQPVPTDQNKVYSINQVYVDCGLDHLTYNDKANTRAWERRGSYQCIFTDQRLVARMRFLEGKVGSGKSTLLLQMAYDWCNASGHSPLLSIELFLLVRLSYCGTLTSIYEQIKRSSLPKECCLSSDDIKQILNKCSSALLVLDDCNFHSYNQDNGDSDITKIMRGEILNNIDVIITRIDTPRAYALSATHLRLTGFDDKARNEYIQKVLVGNDASAADRIKQRLQEIRFVRDFECVPFFFVLLAHFCSESREIPTLTRTMSLCAYILENLRSRLQTGLGTINAGIQKLLAIDNERLGNVACKALCESDKIPIWSTKQILEYIDKVSYDLYLQMGVLVEDELHDSDNGYGDDINRFDVKVQFFHPVFCEWFAAHYMAKCTMTLLSKEEILFIKRSRYLLETCASPSDREEFACLWVLEQGTFVENVLDIVKELFSRPFEFNIAQTEALQRSKISLLSVADENKISISSVCLKECYKLVDLQGGNLLRLKSNLCIPVLTSLEKLSIQNEGIEIRKEDFESILKYSSKCTGLMELRLSDCLMPQSVRIESLSSFGSRDVKVNWNAPIYTYLLNLSDGYWERKDKHKERVMTDEEYRREVRMLKRWEDIRSTPSKRYAVL